MKLKKWKWITLMLIITSIPFLIFGFYYMWKYNWLLEEYKVFEESSSSQIANFTLSVEVSHTYRFTTKNWGNLDTQDDVSTTFVIFIDGVKVEEVYQIVIINYDDEGNLESFDSWKIFDIIPQKSTNIEIKIEESDAARWKIKIYKDIPDDVWIANIIGTILLLIGFAGLMIGIVLVFVLKFNPKALNNSNNASIIYDKSIIKSYNGLFLI